MPVAQLNCSEILAVKATIQSEGKYSIHFTSRAYFVRLICKASYGVEIVNVSVFDLILASIYF